MSSVFIHFDLSAGALNIGPAIQFYEEAKQRSKNKSDILHSGEDESESKIHMEDLFFEQY